MQVKLVYYIIINMLKLKVIQLVSHLAKTDKNQGEHTFFLKSEKRQAKKSVVKTVLICYLTKISKYSTFLIISKLYVENRNSISNFRLSVQI